MNDLEDLYAQARKEDTGDVILADSVMVKMKRELGKKGMPVISSQPYAVMEKGKTGIPAEVFEQN